MGKMFRNYSTVVVHVPRHFKVDGSIPATTAGHSPIRTMERAMFH